MSGAEADENPASRISTSVKDDGSKKQQSTVSVVSKKASDISAPL
jgi:hypothetical protein